MWRTLNCYIYRSVPIIYINLSCETSDVQVRFLKTPIVGSFAVWLVDCSHNSVLHLWEDYDLALGIQRRNCSYFRLLHSKFCTHGLGTRMMVHWQAHDQLTTTDLSPFELDIHHQSMSQEQGVELPTIGLGIFAAASCTPMPCDLK